jgi:hypothetical protein
MGADLELLAFVRDLLKAFNFAFFVRLCGRIVLADLNSTLKGSPP